jgi:hypothetical protein
VLQRLGDSPSKRPLLRDTTSVCEGLATATWAAQDPFGPELGRVQGSLLYALPGSAMTLPGSLLSMHSFPEAWKSFSLTRVPCLRGLDQHHNGGCPKCWSLHGTPCDSL